MNFQEELARRLMAGHKTVTRRAVNTENPRSHWWHEECVYKVGRDYAVCPGRGKDQIGRIEILAVEREHFLPGSISDAEVKAEGFGSFREFVRTWLDLHGDLHAIDVWRVEFKVADIPS